jgi:hypothetical protein
MWQNGPEVADNTGKPYFENSLQLAWYDKTKSIWTDESYQKPQEAQMTSTVVECLQGIQMAKEATAPDKNGSGNLANNDEYFTRADNAHMKCHMCSKCPMEAALLAIIHWQMMG